MKMTYVRLPRQAARSYGASPQEQAESSVPRRGPRRPSTFPLAQPGVLTLTATLTAAVHSLAGAAAEPASPPAPWKYTASASVKETFDSNVYLQSVTPQANQASLVTTFQPSVGATWTPGPNFTATASYTPEATFFHDEESENYTAHRASLGLTGQHGATKYEVLNSLVVIDGDDEGPTWTGPGGAPAAGGVAVRDRRDATVLRHAVKVTQSFGAWRVRPTATFYLHDFQTEQSAAKGYQNYVDRKEFTVGLDLGHTVGTGATAWIGYRFGGQDQSRLLDFREEYDNAFHRVLCGLEGAPVSWLKLQLSLGPELRHFGDRVPTSFHDTDEVNLFVDAAATATLGSRDTVTASLKQFEQPGFSGRATYQDTTADVAWKHKLSTRWTVGTGGRAYNTDFLRPTLRNDWILSASALVNCAVTPAWNLEASYAFEDGLSQVPNTVGREFERHLVSLGAKYVFH